jgi:hypothetical protein
MTINIKKKLTKLIESHTPGTVCLSGWLESLGISGVLQNYYSKSGWLESIGTGAFKRPKEIISWQGALYSLQHQANLPVHAGGLTALSLHGQAHYIRSENELVYLFSPPKTKLPKWFREYNWGRTIENISTSFLATGVGLVEHENRTFNIKISSAERAILECLYLTPDKMNLVECYQVLEGLVNLRPALLQELLESCKSIKVKRLFFYMAEKAALQWFDFIDRSKISLGKGHRSIVKNGVYIAGYDMSIPQELTDL